MRHVGPALASVALLLSGGALAPAIYLHFRAAGDPEGIVDGTLRLTWVMPLLWLLGVWLWNERKFSRMRGMLVVQVPIVITLSLVMVLGMGWRADGTTIVSRAGELTRAEVRKKAQGKAIYEETDFGLIAPVAKWGHRHLPPHPFGRRDRR